MGTWEEQQGVGTVGCSLQWGLPWNVQCRCPTSTRGMEVSRQFWWQPDLKNTPPGGSLNCTSLHPSSDSDKVPGTPTAQHPSCNTPHGYQASSSCQYWVKYFPSTRSLNPRDSLERWGLWPSFYRRGKLPPALDEGFCRIHQFSPVPGDGGCYYRFQEAGHPHQLSPGHVCFPLNSTTARVMWLHQVLFLKTLSTYRIPFSTGSDSCPLEPSVQ